MKHMLNARHLWALFSTLKVHFGIAGLICFELGPWYLHLAVRKRSSWVWGYEEDWYDGPLPSWGLGPLFLLAAIDPLSWCYRCDEWRCVDWRRHNG